MPFFLSKRAVLKIVEEELKPIRFQLQLLNQNQNSIMATQAELAAELTAKTAQIRKAIDEINAKLAMLMDAIKMAPVIPELRAAADNLGIAVQAADDIVPDPAPPAP